MAPKTGIPILFICTVVIRCVLIILESTEKRSIMLPPYSSYPKEAISGSFSRGVFFWLTSLFLNGYKNILFLDDLYPLDEKLRTKGLQANFKEVWDGGKPYLDLVLTKLKVCSFG